MFALLMGLSNFGYSAGGFVGAGLLRVLGGVEAPAFDRLPTFLLLKSLLRLVVPLVLVPTLVPDGTPEDTLAAMGSTLGRYVDAEMVPADVPADQRADWDGGRLGGRLGRAVADDDDESTSSSATGDARDRESPALACSDAEIRGPEGEAAHVEPFVPRRVGDHAAEYTQTLTLRARLQEDGVARAFGRDGTYGE